MLAIITIQYSIHACYYHYTFWFHVGEVNEPNGRWM